MPTFYSARAIPISGESYKDIALHRITFPSYAEPGWNRMVRSANAFRNGRQKGVPADLVKRHFGSCCWDHKGNVLYSLKPEKEQHRETMIMIESAEAASPEVGAKLRAEFEAIPVIEHASLFDFYDYIGFDRHKRRYNERP